MSLPDVSLSETLQPALLSGLKQLGCPLDPGQQRLCLEFIALLDKWNRVYNLTAIREPEKMIGQHLLDSLSVRPYLQGTRILDVGAGAGLPGIPLAIAEPDRQFVLLDSNAKKTRFMTHAISHLHLANAEVVHTRIESFSSDQPFTTIVSRAFASLADFVHGCEHLCSDSTLLLAMKGRHPADEITALPRTWQIKAEHELKVPGLNAERRVLEIMKKI